MSEKQPTQVYDYDVTTVFTPDVGAHAAHMRAFGNGGWRCISINKTERSTWYFWERPHVSDDPPEGD